MLFRKRLEELANRSYANQQYLFTGFLSAAELDIYYQMEHELSYAPAVLFGGTNDCERLMLRFGSEALCGYEELFPIACVAIVPLLEKFGEVLSHRDYLGALMNLGIERSTLEDELSAENIIPSALNKAVADVVAKAVAETAVEEGIARAALVQ